MTGPATTDRRRLVLVAMTLANAMILVDQTAVPLALPDIMQTFGIGTASAQWVLNASLLPLAGLLVLGGRLADLLGRRRVFLVGSALFAGADIAGVSSPGSSSVDGSSPVSRCAGTTAPERRRTPRRR